MARKMRQSGVDWIGEIPEGWKVGHLLNFLRRPISDGPHETPDLVEDGIPFISIDSLNESEQIDFSVVKKYISREDYERFSIKTNLEVGDVLFSKAATIGKTAIVGSEEFMIWSPLAIIKPKHDVCCNRYMYRLLGCEKLIESAKLKGSYNTQANIGMRDLEKVNVPMPPLKEQRVIAAFLDFRCGEIDGIIAASKASIEDYRALKKTLVFESVTGKNLKGKKVASGQDWLGEIPATWDVRRIVNLYREVSERGDDSLPILSVSINTGVSDKELSDEEQERVFIRSEDKTKYKRVQPGDLTYNMMRAWQGAFGAVRVNGMVSPAYVVARPKVEMDSRYVEYLLRSPNATREMQRYSRGIADFRLRLYWPEFKNIRIPCPPLEEQKRIADMLDEKCGEIDAVIADKERLIADLETYKKSLIFEVVTGKREVA